MGSTVDLFAMIRKFFPGREDLVERTFGSNPEFRMLCQDYRICLETLKRLEGSDMPAAHRRRSEYAELLEDLAQEIRDWPEDHPAGEMTEQESAAPRRDHRKE